MHESWDGVNSVVIHFIQACLEMDFRRRKFSSQLLEHPWLIQHESHENILNHGEDILQHRLARNLSMGGLRRTSMVAVAFKIPSKKANMLRNIFQEIDVDRTGSVDKEEFRAAMKLVDPSLSEVDIEIIFDAIDLDGDKLISFIEFVAATIDPREVDIQELNQVLFLPLK